MGGDSHSNSSPPTRRHWLGVSLAGSLACMSGGCGRRKEGAPATLIRGRITSHSMAPHYFGPHLLVSCARCDFEFAMAWEPDQTSDFVCLRCGLLQSLESEPLLQLGEQVRLRPWPTSAGASGELTRFDVVAVATESSAAGPPSNADIEECLFKRVLGLPGERLEFRGGDLFINGGLIKKSWPQQLRQRVLVHCDSPDIQRPGRETIGWQPADQATWERTRQAWSSAQADKGTSGRLIYHHRRCVVTPDRKVPPAPIEDTLAYSQRRPRRLNPISDLMIGCQLRGASGASVRCGLATGTQWAEVQWDFANQQITVLAPGAEQPDVKSTPLMPDRWLDVAVSCFDRQVLVAIGAEVVMQVDFDQVEYSTERSQFSVQPSWWQSQGDVRLRELTLWRDLHLVGPYGDETTWQLGRPLGGEEYFLVGDNLADSVDCRLSGRGVNASQIRAVVSR